MISWDGGIRRGKVVSIWHRHGDAGENTNRAWGMEERGREDGWKKEERRKKREETRNKKEEEAVKKVDSVALSPRSIQV